MEVPPDPAQASSTTVGPRPITPRPLGVAAFAGIAGAGPIGRPVLLEDGTAFTSYFGEPVVGSSLAAAVGGFFANGGRRCWVVRAADSGATAQAAALRIAEGLEEPCVVAAPDAHAAEGAAAVVAVQRRLVAGSASVAGRVAIVDPPPGLATSDVVRWREVMGWNSAAAAAYHPWLSDPGAGLEQRRWVPPCGHVAGLIARVDLDDGVQRAPTGVPLRGATVARTVPADEQQTLNRAGINCLRHWPGPELRVWGGRTLSLDPGSRYLHHERVTGHLVASIAQSVRWIGGSADAPRRALEVDRAVTAYLEHAWRSGVLLGHTAGHAFGVTCEPGLNDDLVLEVRMSVARSGRGRTLRITHRAGSPQAVAAAGGGR